MFSRLRIALSFLTIFPAGGAGTFSASLLTSSALFFPMVGWLVGGIVGGTGWLVVTLGGTPLLAGVLAVTAEAVITRGLHLDGLADVLDGLGGSFEPERRLAIMKDSYIGPFGVIGLVLVLLGKVAALAIFFDQAGTVGFLSVLAAPPAARWAMAALACKSRYPREKGTGHPFVGKVRVVHLVLALVTVVPVFFLGWTGFVVALAAQLPSLWLRQKAHAAFGGVTGDVLGASCELGEVVGWLAGALYLGGVF